MLGFSKTQICKECSTKSHQDICVLSRLSPTQIDAIERGWRAVYLQLTDQIVRLKNNGDDVTGYTKAKDQVIYINSTMAELQLWMRKSLKKPFSARKSSFSQLQFHCGLLALKPSLDTLFADHELGGQQAPPISALSAEPSADSLPPAYTDSAPSNLDTDDLRLRLAHTLSNNNMPPYRSERDIGGLAALSGLAWVNN